MEQRHQVKRHILEIRAPDPEQARALQAELRQMHSQRIAPLVERVCSELSAPDRLHHIDSLAVDLGTIETHNFAENYMAALERALRQALAQEIRTCEGVEGQHGHSSHVRSHLDLIADFACTGTLPWWADTGASDVPRRSMQALLASAPQALANLVRNLASEPDAIWRLVRCCDEAMLADLVKLLTPRRGRDLVTLTRELLGLLQASSPVANTPAKHWRHLLWRHILRTAALSTGGHTEPSITHASQADGAHLSSQTPADDPGTAFEIHALVSNSLLQIALDLGVTYRGLIATLFEHVEAPSARVSRSMHEAIVSAYRAAIDRPRGSAGSPGDLPLAQHHSRGLMERPSDTPDSATRTRPAFSETGARSLGRLLAALWAQADQPAASGQLDPEGLASRPLDGPETPPLHRDTKARDESAGASTPVTTADAVPDRTRGPRSSEADQAPMLGLDGASGPVSSGSSSHLEGLLEEAMARGTVTPELLEEAIARGTVTPELLEEAMARGTVTPELLEQCLAALHGTEATDRHRGADADTPVTTAGEVPDRTRGTLSSEADEAPIDADVSSASGSDTDYETSTYTNTDASDLDAAPMLGLDGASGPVSSGSSSHLEGLLQEAMARGTVTPELLEQCLAALHGTEATDRHRHGRSALRRTLQQALTGARGARPDDRDEIHDRTPRTPQQRTIDLRQDRLAASQRAEPPPDPALHVPGARRVPARRPPRRPSALEEVYINNSGLAILSPFLERFFTRTGLLDDKHFIDQAAVQRAVGLLQCLANPDAFEDDEPPEYILPLNKLLCGMEIDEVFALDRPLTHAEMEECDRLLTAIIHNAPVLRDMSVQGFRGTFLLRDGILRTRDGAWLLNVERQTYDVVLDRFPWSWTWVKLPWMQAPLRVEW